MSNGRDWTDDDTAELRRLVARGDSDGDIAKAMGRGRTLIVRKRAEFNLEAGVSPEETAMVARINMRQQRARA